MSIFGRFLATVDCSCRQVPASEFTDGSGAFAAVCQMSTGADVYPWCYVSNDVSVCPSPEGSDSNGGGNWKKCAAENDVKAIEPAAA